MDDFYKDFCKNKLNLKSKQGLSKDQLALFAQDKPKKQKVDCEGCRLGAPSGHTGVYAKIMDWQTGKGVRFVDIVENRSK